MLILILSDSWLHSIGNLFTDHVVLYYTKGLCHPLSDVCHITGRKRRGKGLEDCIEVLCKCNHYCGPTKDPALIRDPAFIFAIMLPQPLNETRYLYETSHNLRQYGIKLMVSLAITVYEVQ